MPGLQCLVAPLPRLVQLKPGTKSGAASFIATGLSAAATSLAALPADVQAQTTLIFEATIKGGASSGLQYCHELSHIPKDHQPWQDITPVVDLLKAWLSATEFKSCVIRNVDGTCYEIELAASRSGGLVMVPSGLMPVLADMPVRPEQRIVFSQQSALDSQQAKAFIQAAIKQFKAGRRVALYLDLDNSTLLPLQTVCMHASAMCSVTMINPALLEGVVELAKRAKDMDCLPLLSIQFITARDLPAGCSQLKVNEAVSALLGAGLCLHRDLYASPRSALSVIKAFLTSTPDWLQACIKQSCPHIGGTATAGHASCKRDFVDRYFNDDVVGKTRTSVLNCLFDDSADEVDAFESKPSAELLERGCRFMSIKVLSATSVDPGIAVQLQDYSDSVRRHVAIRSLRRHSLCASSLQGEERFAGTAAALKPRSASFSVTN